MKAYTDLEQSKKLAEFLPLESADMYYPYFGDNKWGETARFGEALEYSGKKDILCWSLSALLDVLESEIDGEEGEIYQLNIEKEGTWWYLGYKEQYDNTNPIEVESTETLVDACYEMIIRLNELKML